MIFSVLILRKVVWYKAFFFFYMIFFNYNLPLKAMDLKKTSWVENYEDPVDAGKQCSICIHWYTATNKKCYLPCSHNICTNCLNNTIKTSQEQANQANEEELFIRLILEEFFGYRFTNNFNEHSENQPNPKCPFCRKSLANMKKEKIIKENPVVQEMILLEKNQCPLCEKKYEKKATLPCGHFICKNCIKEKEDLNNCCPACGLSFKNEIIEIN